MSTWAYQVENYEPAPDEELICSVCQGVFNDPTQPHCQHVFCRGCLMQWLSHSSTCPICREPVNCLTVRSAPPLVRSLVGKLRVRCPTCHGDPMSIDDANKHCCPEVLVRCPACQTMVKRGVIAEHHRRTCPQRTELCPCCKLRVPPRPADTVARALPARMVKHDCVSVLKRKLEDNLKEKVKRIKELEDRVRQLEEEVSANNRNTESSSSEDGELVSHNNESLRRSSSEDEPNSDVHESWVQIVLEEESDEIQEDNSPSRPSMRRMEKFRSIFSELFRERRTQSLSLEELIKYVIEKADQQQLFTAGEIGAVLVVMTEDNQVMVANNIVFPI